jgi:hypothetical protein
MGLHRALHVNHEAKEQRHQNARADAGDEEFADALLVRIA